MNEQALKKCVNERTGASPRCMGAHVVNFYRESQMETKKKKTSAAEHEKHNLPALTENPYARVGIQKLKIRGCQLLKRILVWKPDTPPDTQKRNTRGKKINTKIVSAQMLHWPTNGRRRAQAENEKNEPAENERHAAWEALFLKKTSATLHGSAPGRPPGATRPPQDQDKTAHWKSIDFSSKMLVFHWKNVGLEPKRAFYITF